MEAEIERAYKDWQQAINIFNNAFEKEEVDFAIYNLEAKRRHYIRLLNKLKKENEEQSDFEQFNGKLPFQEFFVL